MNSYTDKLSAIRTWFDTPHLLNWHKLSILSKCVKIANIIFVVGHISAKIPDPIRTLKSNAAEGP